jgi:RNA 2',3'-cyclic 3'-phosphodiesterase
MLIYGNYTVKKINMDTTRAFIAVPVMLPAELLDKAEDLKNEIISEGWGIKWVNFSQLHVTLRFLGEIESSLIPEISGSLEELLSDCTGGQINVTGFGFFGRRKDPRVLWMGLDGEEIFTEMKRRVDLALKNILPGEEVQPFKPHLTIGRVKYPGNPRVLADILEFYSKDLEIPVELNRVIFYKSELQKKGPLYSPLKIIILR